MTKTKIVQLEDNRVHWITDYTWDDFIVEVEQENGVVEKQNRFSPDVIFVEAPDDVQVGFIYLGDGKFRSNELELLQAQLDQVETTLRKEFEDLKFFAWLETLFDMSSMPKDENNITEINIFSQDYKPIKDHETAIKQLAKQRLDILQKLEALKNSEIKIFS